MKFAPDIAASTNQHFSIAWGIKGCNVGCMKKHSVFGPRKELGAILTDARERFGLSRAALAKRTGITEVSLARYEKAGLDVDGQYPPSPKLAVLTIELGLDLTRLLLACVPAEDYEQWEHKVLEHDSDAPSTGFLMDQISKIRHDNSLLHMACRVLLKIEKENKSDFPYDDDDINWLRGQLEKAFIRHVSADMKLKALEIDYVPDRGHAMTFNKDREWEYDYANPTSGFVKKRKLKTLHAIMSHQLETIERMIEGPGSSHTSPDPSNTQNPQPKSGDKDEDNASKP